MVWISLKWFPSKTVRKLQACNVRPFMVLKWNGPIVYVIDISLDYDCGISTTFNLDDFVAYKG